MYLKTKESDFGDFPDALALTHTCCRSQPYLPVGTKFDIGKTLQTSKTFHIQRGYKHKCIFIIFFLIGDYWSLHISTAQQPQGQRTILNINEQQQQQHKTNDVTVQGLRETSFDVLLRSNRKVTAKLQQKCVENSSKQFVQAAAAHIIAARRWTGTNVSFDMCPIDYSSLISQSQALITSYFYSETLNQSAGNVHEWE